MTDQDLAPWNGRAENEQHPPAYQVPVPTSPAYVPTQYQPVQSPLPPVEYRARLTPTAPLGHPGVTDGAAMAELGALLASLGAEKGAVTALLHEIQQINVQTSMAGMHVVLELVQKLIRARINTVMQGVRTLPDVYMPAAGFRGLTGAPAPGSPAYVTKDSVLNILNAAMAQLPNTN